MAFWFSVGGWYMFLCLVGSDLCIDLVLGCVVLDTVVCVFWWVRSLGISCNGMGFVYCFGLVFGFGCWFGLVGVDSAF